MGDDATERRVTHLGLETEVLVNKSLNSSALRADAGYEIPLWRNSAISLGMVQDLREGMLLWSEPLAGQGGMDAKSTMSAA